MVDKNPQILIVDDEPVVCDVLHDELSERGCLCTTAFDGNEALAKLATQDFDVVLLDIKLPGISGIEVLRKMQSNHPTTAAIMITGINDVDVAAVTMKLGASDYIVKPFDLNRVNASVHAVLETKKHYRDRDEEDWATHLDAIARGVELRLESLTREATTKTIVERTVAVALEFDIPEGQIKRWVAARLEQNAERIKLMDSLLKKLEQNPITQIVLGVAEPYQCPPGHESRLN